MLKLWDVISHNLSMAYRPNRKLFDMPICYSSAIKLNTPPAVAKLVKYMSDFEIDKTTFLPSADRQSQFHFATLYFDKLKPTTLSTAKKVRFIFHTVKL